MKKYIINPITGDKILSTEFIVNDYYIIKEKKNHLEQELQKYKSLYENEKEHTDTLKRIIKEVKEYLEGTFEMSTYTKSVYLDEESIEEILDLLKEIK